MSEGRYSTVRPVGREHFPETPKGFIAIRIIQLILAVAALGVDAYVLSNVLFDGVELTMFVSIATMIACIYFLVVEFGKGSWKGYNYWAVLSLDIFLLMFWLIAFALDAARMAPFANGWTICDGWECIYYPVEAYMELFACMCTVTGLGGVEFILFIVSLSIHSVAMHRHRTAGLHCKALSAFERDNHHHHHHNNNNNNNAANNAPVGQITTTTNTNTKNNNNVAVTAASTNNTNNIPLQEKHDHPAPSYVSAVPSAPQQQQHQHHPQSPYTLSATATPHTANSPYQPPAPPAPATTSTAGTHQQYQQPAFDNGAGAGYYEAHHHHQQQQQQQHHHHHQNSSMGGDSFSGGGPVVVPAPHPGSHEAPGSPAGYA